MTNILSKTFVYRPQHNILQPVPVQPGFMVGGKVMNSKFLPAGVLSL